MVRRPNLILLTVECWRSDHFSEQLTPCLSRLGSESAVFPDTLTSGGWTLPAMTALMSSTYASLHGGCSSGLSDRNRPALAEKLREIGYQTAGFSANPVCGAINGFNRGFDTFADVSRSPAVADAWVPTDETDFQRFVERGIPPNDLDTWCGAADVAGAGLRWLGDRTTDEPCFLWLHLMDTHWPYVALDRPADPSELYEVWYDRHLYRSRVPASKGTYDVGHDRRARWASRYRQSVHGMDAAISMFLDALRARPDWEHTIVAVTGDHGEELFEHGRWHHSWSHLHRESIQVPFIIRIPGSASSEYAQGVTHLDIAPTLLDYAGVPSSPPTASKGTSLRALIEGGELVPRPRCTEMMAHPGGSAYVLAISDGNWKYVYDFEYPHQSRLCLTDRDPAEENNLREQYPEVFRRFEQLRLAHVSLGLTRLMTRRHADETDGGMSELVRRQMKALGYISD